MAVRLVWGGQGGMPSEPRKCPYGMAYAAARAALRAEGSEELDDGPGTGGASVAKPYGKLRGLMREYEDTQVTLGRLLAISPRSVSDRMMGRAEWKLCEMYAIMDHYRVPHKRLHEIFTPGGRNE